MRSCRTLVIKIRGWNKPISACLHHNPPHCADVMLMNTEEKAQPQNCPLSFTAEGGERARSGDTETAQRNLMILPENSKQLKLLYFVMLLCINAVLDAGFFFFFNFKVTYHCTLFSFFWENMLLCSSACKEFISEQQLNAF